MERRTDRKIMHRSLDVNMSKPIVIKPRPWTRQERETIITRARERRSGNIRRSLAVAGGTLCARYGGEGKCVVCDFPGHAHEHDIHMHCAEGKTTDNVLRRAVDVKVCLRAARILSGDEDVSVNKLAKNKMIASLAQT